MANNPDDVREIPRVEDRLWDILLVASYDLGAFHEIAVVMDGPDEICVLEGDYLGPSMPWRRMRRIAAIAGKDLIGEVAELAHSGKIYRLPVRPDEPPPRITVGPWSYLLQEADIELLSMAMSEGHGLDHAMPFLLRLTSKSRVAAREYFGTLFSDAFGEFCAEFLRQNGTDILFLCSEGFQRWSEWNSRRDLSREWFEAAERFLVREADKRAENLRTQKRARIEKVESLRAKHEQIDLQNRDVGALIARYEGRVPAENLARLRFTRQPSAGEIAVQLLVSWHTAESSWILDEDARRQIVEPRWQFIDWLFRGQEEQVWAAVERATGPEALQAASALKAECERAVASLAADIPDEGRSCLAGMSEYANRLVAASIIDKYWRYKREVRRIE